MTTMDEEQRFQAYVNMIEQKTKRSLTEEELKKIRFIAEVESADEFAHLFEATVDEHLES